MEDPDRNPGTVLLTRRDGEKRHRLRTFGFIPVSREAFSLGVGAVALTQLVFTLKSYKNQRFGLLRIARYEIRGWMILFS
jgi:hypothetical protein